MGLPADELGEIEIQTRAISEAEGVPYGEVLDYLLGVYSHSLEDSGRPCSGFQSL